tara:strand:+ start:506 stop:913 length:408 start_codon:yes stop_codon:yes gene_type:complete
MSELKGPIEREDATIYFDVSDRSLLLREATTCLLNDFENFIAYTLERAEKDKIDFFEDQESFDMLMEHLGGALSFSMNTIVSYFTDGTEGDDDFLAENLEKQLQEEGLQVSSRLLDMLQDNPELKLWLEDDEEEE